MPEPFNEALPMKLSPGIRFEAELLISGVPLAAAWFLFRAFGLEGFPVAVTLIWMLCMASLWASFKLGLVRREHVDDARAEAFRGTLLRPEDLGPSWEEIRSRGRQRFILRFGVRNVVVLFAPVWMVLVVLMPGVPFLMDLAFRRMVPEALDPTGLNMMASFGPGYWLSALATVPIILLIGYLWSSVEWRRREERFATGGGSLGPS